MSSSALNSRILEVGAPCEAEIVRTQPLGMRTPAGEDMYAFVLMVAGVGQPSYKVWVGSAVPAAALSLLSVGTRLPARRLPNGDDTELVVDWEAALADRPGNQRRVASKEE
jgi:hypothetical protein